jgi:cephalosporin-C deacetylase-like acetyl esterase
MLNRQSCLSRSVLILACCCLGRASAQHSDAEALDFLHGLSEYEQIRRMLPEYMEREAQSLISSRQRSLDISTPDALARRRARVRERILHAIGGLPDRTPLNARTVETLQRDGYRIEKVIFESQPHFYVTANLYLPATGDAPHPAVLYPLGHELGGKSNPTWQQMLITLARRGYVALTWDPLGQGERVQIYDDDLRGSKLRSSTTEHTIQGTQCLLTGEHVARYTIWDGIRALDYLLSRKEVDPARIAVTGNSGGGTHSAYLAALDDRIKIAAPSCYITSWHWMMKTLGPQDAEQVFPGWLADGLDYPDFIYAAGSKPYLMLSAIRDFFPIDGARETFREAKPYANLSMFEADDGHGYSQPRRLAAYDWISRFLRDREDTAPETLVAPESAETLFSTPTGQVATSLGGETVFSLNRARADRLRQNRLQPTDSASLPSWQSKVRRAAITRSGFQPASGPFSSTPYGSLRREGYRIDKLTYESEPGILIAALLYIPESGPARRPAVILVDGEGKSTSASATAAEELARSGVIVLSVDLRGMGETRITPDLNDSEFYRYFGDYEDGMTAMLMNRTLPGMRARDILRGLDLLAARDDVDPDRLSGIGRNTAAVPLLYAAVFDNRLRSIALEGMLLSYDAVVTTRIHKFVFEQIVPSALVDFDLPDLAAALAPRTVWISDSTTPAGASVTQAEVAHAYSSTVRAFQLAGAAGALRIEHPRPEDARAAEYYHDLLNR